MRVEIDAPQLLPELVSLLLASDCIVHRADGTSCRVIHVAATDAAEAEHELAFFLKAWQGRHDGVSISITA